MRGAAARRLLAASALAGLLVGIPSVLVRLGGWPLPRRLPDAATFDRLLSGRVEVDAAKVIAVVVWTAVLPLLVGLAVELASCIRGMPAPRLPVIGPIQPILARLVTTAFLTTAPSIPRPALAEVPAPAVVVADAAPSQAVGEFGEKATRASVRARPDVDRPSYRVKRFDTFIGIAEELVPGGASRWPELFELNRGAVQPSGKPLLQPEDLEEDSVIVLTADARADSSAEAAASPDRERSSAEDSVEWAPYLVRRGDWVSTVVWQRVPTASIERVREIVDVVETVNVGSPQPYGGVFEDADSVFPGWTILVPVSVSAELGAPVPLPQRASEGRDSEGEAHPVESGVGEALPTAPVPPPGAPLPSPEGADACAPAPAEREPGGGATRLPAGSAVYLVVALGIAGLLGRSRISRRRAYRPSDPTPARAAGTEDDGSTRALGEMARAARRLIERTRRLSPAEPSAGPGDEGDPTVDPVTLGTVWLEGGGADAAVRGLVVRALVAPGRTPARVLVDAATSVALLGVEQSIPGLEVLPSAEDVLAEIDVERVRRTRLLDEAGVPDLPAYQLEPCDELLGPVLAVARPSESDARRWAETLAAGRLGINALLLGGAGQRPAGSRAAAVDNEGRLEWVAGEAPIGGRARVDQVTPGDLAVLLAAVADERRLRERPKPLKLAAEPFPVDELDVAPASAGDAPQSGRPAAIAAVADSPPRSGAVPTVRLLGPFAICVGGRPVGAGFLDKGRELLAYLALRPDGSRRERILEELWADVDPVRRQDRFSAAVSNLRGRFRAELGDPDIDVVQWHGDTYRLDQSILDVDLWRFHRALSEARGADDVEAEARALDVAVAAYGGEFVEESPWEWVEAERENLRRRALDAAVRLAELERASGRVDEAVRVVERAIEIDPYAEDLYVRIAATAPIESARALYKALVRHLEDIDAEPMPETIEAVGSVLAARAREAARRAAEEVPTRNGASQAQDAGSEAS